MRKNTTIDTLAKDGRFITATDLGDGRALTTSMRAGEMSTSATVRRDEAVEHFARLRSEGWR